MTVESGALYVVATPIGNLEDISARALRVLREGEADTPEIRRLLTALLLELPVSRAAAVVAAKLTGLRKKPLYDLALTLGL